MKFIYFILQSHDEEQLSEGDLDSARDHEDQDSCDGRGTLLADHGDVLAKLKMQVRDIKVGVRILFNLLFLCYYSLLLHHLHCN